MRFDGKLLLALLPFLALCAYSLTFNGHVMDEYTYILMARSYAANDFFNAPDQSRFPAFPFALSLVYRVWDGGLLAGRLLGILFGLAALVLVYSMGKKFFGEEAGFWATALLGASPVFAFFSDKVLSEPMFIALLVACAWLVVKAGEDRKWLIAIGASVSLLVLTRFFGLYLAPIALLYWWRRGQLQILASTEFAIGILAFLAVSAPWLAFSTAITGNPIGLLREFFSSNVIFEQGGFALADRIPSYLLLAPFIAGAAIALILLYPKRVFAEVSSGPGFIALASAVVIAASLEVHGFLQFRLLRYLVPAAPFVALIAGAGAVALAKKGKPLIGKAVSWRWLPIALLAANFIAALMVMHIFGGLDKYSGYHEVGVFAAANCQSHYSNIERVLQVYSGKAQVPIGQADCAVESKFNPNVVGANFSAGRELIYSNKGMSVWRLKHA
jgi:4-amino-4-deoxy-L-arabinose transferase-like glycosyltransferase